MSRSGVKLKAASGWFAAGVEMQRAATVLPDNAFKVYVWLCLHAERDRGCLQLNPEDIAADLHKTQDEIRGCLLELDRSGVCHCDPTNLVRISDSFWPYTRTEEAMRDAHEAERYISEVKRLFLARACVSTGYTPADDRIAAEWYRTGVSLEAVERAIQLGCLRLDRGYTDYEWFRRLTEQDVHFVTRLKDNAACLLIESRRPEGAGILADQIIALEKQAQADIETAPFLRRVRYRDEATAQELVFLTNHLDLPASIIAAIYKERWQIELLFKALKQKLRIKTFVGTTANALKTQIWTALIALLAVKFLQLQSNFSWSLSRLIALLRQQLFVYRDLWRWIDSPFEPPLPLSEDDSPQLPFAWTS